MEHGKNGLSGVQATQNEAAKLCNQIAVIEIEFWDMAMKA